MTIAGEPVNVALNKASIQSSIFSTRTGQEFPAENGVDGNNATCISTKMENAPWWEVDLGHIFPILNITIYARPFCEQILNIQTCLFIAMTCLYKTLLIRIFNPSLLYSEF